MLVERLTIRRSLLTPSDNRILAVPPDVSWRFDAPELCNQSGEQHRYLACLFLPTTTCPLPADWQDRTVRMTSMGMPADIVGIPAAPSFNFTSSKQGIWSLSNNPVLAEHQNKSPVWWQAQLVKFVMRPSEYTLKHIVWPLQQAAFYRTQGVLPRPLAAVFIRAGDKFIEARPLSVDDHFAELAPVAATLGVKHVYLGSDSHDRIAEAMDKYGTNYTFHFIDWSRPETGLAMRDVIKAKSSWRMSELVRLAVADIFVTAQADVTVGTLSSNWARLGDEFRRANGKSMVPYLNPEKPRARSVKVP